MIDFKFHFHHVYRTGSGTAKISMVEFGSGLRGKKPIPYQAIHIDARGKTELRQHDADGKALPWPGEEGKDLSHYDLQDLV